MDTLRGRLINKIDDILAHVVVANDTPLNSQLNIEANLVLPNDPNAPPRRVLLDSINIDQLRHDLASQASTPLATTPHPAVMFAQPIFSGATHMDIVPTQPAAYDHYAMSPADLSPVPSHVLQETPPSTPPLGTRQQGNDFERPINRRRPQIPPAETRKSDQMAIDKLIEGIWEQIHNPKSLAMGDELRESMEWILERMSGRSGRYATTNSEFSNATKCCRQITTSSRTARAFEVIVQAHWIDCYDARLAALRDDRPELRTQEHKKMVLTEACTSFSWSEKELRNRMAIWKGYREIKDTAGWSALIFAGAGVYRFCKYRLGFDEDSMNRLAALKQRAEVAADTLQPHWRQLLALVGELPQIVYHGHPHDWTVSLTKDDPPLPLASTYGRWDPNFTFAHIEESIIDTNQFPHYDPRRFEEGPEFYCPSCGQRQSASAEDNDCECFPTIYSPNPRAPTPVQIFRTDEGKNNGLIACCRFEQGQAVGEFVGVITKGLNNVDVMQGQAGDNEPYQIFQQTHGNFTRFINHSCVPNCQLKTFSWLGVQRIVVVSNGVPAGVELTTDYGEAYWENLDKICLCGHSSCRYKHRRKDDPA